MIGTLALAALAGVLSILSPCVLPLVPIVLGAAVSEHRLGPLALAAGLALSFTAIGLFVATLGFAIGLDASIFRLFGAAILILLGLVLMLPAAQMRFALAATPLSAWVENRFGGASGSGITGQFGIGLVLGAVWSPCVGPTLGAASVLAAQGRDLGAVALTMLAFGVGAGLPLALFGLLSRQTLLKARNGLMQAGKGGKIALGVLFLVAGLLIATGYDKRIEAALVDLSPAWLTDLTTRF